MIEALGHHREGEALLRDAAPTVTHFNRDGVVAKLVGGGQPSEIALCIDGHACGGVEQGEAEGVAVGVVGLDCVEVGRTHLCAGARGGNDRGGIVGGGCYHVEAEGLADFSSAIVDRRHFNRGRTDLSGARGPAHQASGRLDRHASTFYQVQLIRN